MKKIYSLISIVVLLLFSCSEEKLLSPPKQPQRTILVYLAGDNNLYAEVQEKIDALKQGWNEKLGELLIFADTFGKEQPVLLRLIEENNKVTTQIIKHYDNDNSASPVLLKKVIADVKNMAPASSYGMILFSHATGWLPTGAFENPLNWRPKVSSYSVFEDKDRQMELANFAEAIPKGMFDFLVFDMCFMAGIESTYALRNKTPYILASSAEILSPGFSAIYTNSLSKLYTETADLKDFAKDFFNYFSTLQPPYKSATISVINTAPIERLARAVKELAVEELSQEQINKLQAFDRKTPHLFFDFTDYYQKAAPASEQVKLKSILDEIIVYKAHTDKLINIAIKKHSGLSVYIPQTGLHLLNEAHKQTAWRKFVSN